MSVGAKSYRALDNPSKATLRAAKAAAASPHGLINLVRLVQGLDTATLEDEADEDQAQRSRKDAETAQYARLLLNQLRDANEQSSDSGRTLDQMDQTLQSLERRYQMLPTNVLKTTFQTVPSPSNHSPSSPHHIASPPVIPTSAPESMPITTQPPSSRARRRNINTAEYLRNRAKEDAAGAEVGLLPLRVVPVKLEKSSRDQLLDGVGSGLGSRQLHEELGGQLADMSHRLKLNALHFASSLNDEKDLLESSQGTLENNLVATRSSKKDLALVSKKGRGTTCMTLGVIILVLVIFVWTYMLIRFT